MFLLVLSCFLDGESNLLLSVKSSLSSSSRRGLFKIFAKIVNKLQKQIDVNRFSLINRKNKSLFISFRGFFCNFEGESHFRANGQRSKVKGLIRRP